MDLNWNKSTPRVWLTAEDDDFDQSTIQHWADEGFEVFYLAYDKHKKKEYRDQLSHIPDKLGFGEKFAIVGSLDHPLLFTHMAKRHVNHNISVRRCCGYSPRCLH
jgi:hypothetical protein